MKVKIRGKEVKEEKGADQTATIAFASSLIGGIFVVWLTAAIIGSNKYPGEDEKAMLYALSERYPILILAFIITAIIVTFVVIWTGPHYEDLNSSSGLSGPGPCTCHDATAGGDGDNYCDSTGCPQHGGDTYHGL